MDIYWKRIKYIIYVISVLLIILLGAGWYVKSHNYHLLQSGKVLAQNDDFVFGIDVAEDSYYLFRLSTDGKQQDFFEYPMMQGEYFTSLRNCVMDANGVVYLCVDSNSDSDVKANIGICDFNNGEILLQEDVYELALENRNYMGNFIVNQNEFYLLMMSIETDSYKYSLYTLKEDGSYKFYKELSEFEAMGGLLIGNDLETLRMDQDGNFYKEGRNGEDQLVFLNDGSQISSECVPERYENGILSFWDIENQKGYGISIKDNVGTIELETSRKSNLDYGIKILEDGRKVLVKETGEGPLVIDKIKESKAHTMERWIDLSKKLIMIVMLYLFAIFLLRRKKGGVPVWGYMVLIIAPFIMIGQKVMFVTVDKQMEDFYEKTQALHLAQIGRNYELRLDKNKFEEYASYPRITPEQNLELMIQTEFFPVIYKGIEEQQDVSASFYSRSELFYYKDGTFTAVGTNSYKLNCSMKYQCDAKMLEAMEMAVEERKDVYAIIEKNESEWERNLAGGSQALQCGAVFSPIESTDGTVIGVLATIEGGGFDLKKNLINKQIIHAFVYSITFFLLLIVLFVMYLNMKALKKLNNGILDFTEGNLDTRIKIRGRSEIAGLSRRFNHIAETTQIQLQETEAYQKRYKAFLPERLFEILQKKGVQSITPGDVKRIAGTVLAINSRAADKAEGIDIIASVNKSMAIQVPIIEEGGGIILHFLHAGVESVFVGEERQNTLSTAVSVIQSERQFAGEGTLCAGITEGTMNLGAVGSSKRSRVALVSHQRDFAWFLWKLARECCSTVLITARAAKQIEDFSMGYHYRILGYVYVRVKEELELVYEILDSERDGARRKKMLTKELFESGVEAFMTNQMGQARRYFIKVVDQDKEDQAAIKYIHLCEMYLEKSQVQEVLCLEVY